MARHLMYIFAFIGQTSHGWHGHLRRSRENLLVSLLVADRSAVTHFLLHLRHPSPEKRCQPNWSMATPSDIQIFS
jgi:hypothetical protein